MGNSILSDSKVINANYSNMKNTERYKEGNRNYSYRTDYYVFFHEVPPNLFIFFKRKLEVCVQSRKYGN